MAAALASTRACRRIVGVARRRSTLATARAWRFIDEGTTDLAEGVGHADVVVLCTPVNDIIAKIKGIGALLKPGCVLMDVGSTKRAICAAMETLPEHVQPVGGHPMCGKETSGLTMAEPSLYQDKVFVLTPLERTSPQALGLAYELVQAVGARPLLLDPARHDRLVAIISHLPYMMAVALVNAADALARQDPLAWTLAAGGFRDTSRVAGGSVPMMMDILLTNREPVLGTLCQAREQIDKLINCLERGDDVELQALLEAARRRRTEVYR
ncbi:MAG: prephenate dehydrogenase/arogenate dehydrogenase family protein [Chloroflexi bacterium]|nr:prephenate dehydrogenase/arogenate dehydrogenase family protein [Chloroflexota bacterium]